MRTFHTGATNISCIQSVPAVTAEFYDPHIIQTSLKIGLDSARLNRKTIPKNDASGKKGPVRAGRRSKAPVRRLTAAKRGKDKCRIYNQNTAVVIMSDIKSYNLVLCNPVFYRNGFPFANTRLV